MTCVRLIYTHFWGSARSFFNSLLCPVAVFHLRKTKNFALLHRSHHHQPHWNQLAPAIQHLLRARINSHRQAVAKAATAMSLAWHFLHRPPTGNYPAKYPTTITDLPTHSRTNANRSAEQIPCPRRPHHMPSAPQRPKRRATTTNRYQSYNRHRFPSICICPPSLQNLLRPPDLPRLQFFCHGCEIMIQTFGNQPTIVQRIKRRRHAPPTLSAKWTICIHSLRSCNVDTVPGTSWRALIQRADLILVSNTHKRGFTAIWVSVVGKILTT